MPAAEVPAAVSFGKAITGSMPAAKAAPRTNWLNKLKAGLRKTGSSLATVFTGTQIDEALYEELESALLMADTGVKATKMLGVDVVVAGTAAAGLVAMPSISLIVSPTFFFFSYPSFLLRMSALLP